jgi:hypothetical protein
MNTKLVNSAADVILRALTQNRTAAGIALALESAQLLQSPETAAESAHYRSAFEAQRSRAETLDGLLRTAQDRVAELEAAQGTVYRASHDSIVMGLYTTAAAAREHCETLVRREYTSSGIADLKLSWREGEDAVDQPEDGEQELIEHVGPHFARPTGYVVTALEIAAKYDPDGDE